MNVKFQTQNQIVLTGSKNFKLNYKGGVEDPTFGAMAKHSKKSEANAKDRLFEDRPSRGQGQECSKPRTGMIEANNNQRHKSASDLKKNSSSRKLKLRFSLVIFPFHGSKYVLEPRTAFSRTCRIRGQGLELRDQGQGLQNGSSKTPLLLNTI